ncbi:MAG: hypothetical protein R3B96_12635 [Pirellulaceae bacterium]
MKRTWRLALLGGTCGILILPGFGPRPGAKHPVVATGAASAERVFLGTLAVAKFRGSDGLEVVQPSLSDGDSIPTEVEIATVSQRRLLSSDSSEFQYRADQQWRAASRTPQERVAFSQYAQPSPAVRFRCSRITVS